MSCWNYRLVKHDLPNQDGNVYIHEVNYDEDRNPEGCTQVSESPCANLSEDWYTDLNLQGGLEMMNWELDRLKDDINRNPEILNYSQFVPERITNIHSMTLDNALCYGRVIWLGISEGGYCAPALCDARPGQMCRPAAFCSVHQSSSRR